MPGMRVFGFVQRLQRKESETDGTIALRGSVGGKIRTVSAVLGRSDYDEAIDAHRTKSPVIAEGDLERVGQRWFLRNPRITEVIPRGEAPENGE